MDLIDRAAAIEEVDYTVTSVSVCATVEQARGATWAKGRIRERLEKMPTIEAVPLDKLCDLLSKHLGKIRCNDCWVACSDPCPGTADDWRRVITNWMEGLDDHE